MQHSPRSGFTLIEVVVATAIMVTIVAGVSHVVLLAADQSTRHRRDLQALVLAQSKLEELRASPRQPVSGDEQLASGVRRWWVSTASGASPSTLLLRVCAGHPAVCVASLRVMP